MNRVATMAVIREDGIPVIHREGECAEFMYNLVKDELVRVNTEYKTKLAIVTAERDSARMKNNNRQTRDLMELRARLEANPSLWERFVDKIETAWCVCWAMLVELGLIGRVGSGKSNI